MSEKPQGYPLPEDLINGLENIAAKKTKRKGPETKAERIRRQAEERRSKVVSEKAPEEVIDVVGEVIPEEVVWERPERDSGENVSARLGGMNSKVKAEELLEAADNRDIDRSIFERAKVFAENKKGAVKRPLKENLAKVDFNDPDEIEVEMPSEKSIEELEFNLDKPKEKNFKEEVDRRVGGFDSRKVASRLVEKANYDDYERDLEQSISGAQSIDQLLQIIDTQLNDKKGLQGSQDNFKKSDLKMIIEMLRDKEAGVGIEHVTRSAGLRQKVFDLLNEKQTTVPENKYMAGKETPVAPDLSAKNAPLVGEDKPTESTYTPEQFAKDPNVFVLPKNESGIEVNNELPEAPLEPLKETDYPEVSEEEKNFAEIRRDVAKLEMELDLKRSELQRLLLDKDDVWDEVEGKPWKKFLLKIDWKGKIRKMDASLEAAAKDFRKITEELIEKKTDSRLYELHAMHPNTRERKEVEMIHLIDIPSDLLNKFPEAIEVFEENGNVIHIKALNKADIKLPREFKVAINEIYPDLVRSKVLWRVTDDHRASEKQDLLHYLLQD